MVYVGGLYRGKANEKQWEKVKEYIEKQYETEAIEKIYFQSDGGSWMKKGSRYWEQSLYWMNSISKSISKRWHGWEVEERREKASIGLTEREEKKLLESWNYIKNNWKGMRRRIKKEEGVIGSSTEGHISHVLSARMSSRPMGWSRQGADKLSQVRIYWKNGGDMQELIQRQKKEKREGDSEEETCFSSSEILSWEKKIEKPMGNILKHYKQA